MNQWIFVIAVLTLGSCASTQQTNVPDAELVTLSREEPDPDCKDLGPVTGSSLSVKGTHEDSLQDLKKDAARRGANYVQLLGHSATGSSASGVAYICP